MKQFGKLKVTNKEFRLIVRKYIRFYENVNECGNQCPMGGKEDFIFSFIHSENWVDNIIEKYDIIEGSRSTSCFCNQLPMFPDYDCPCYVMGEKAFVALEEMIKEYAPQIIK